MRTLVLAALVGCSSSGPSNNWTPPEGHEITKVDSLPAGPSHACDPPSGDPSPVGDASPSAEAGSADLDSGVVDSGPDTSPPDAFAPVDAGPATKPRMLVYGNSIVGGVRISDYGLHGTSWPAILGDALGAGWESDKWIARYGWSTSAMTFSAKDDLLPYSTGAELRRTRRVLVFYETTNEIHIFPYCKDSTARFVGDRAREGWSVVVTTVLPTVATMVGGSQPSNVANRIAYNDWIRANWQAIGASGLADVGGDARLQDAKDVSMYPDGSHPSDAANAIMAEVTLPVVRSLYVQP